MVPKRLTVVLLTYNRSEYLKQAVEGILGQSFGDFELLVMDNNSSDDTDDVVRSYRDPRIIYVRQPTGVNAAENHVTGEWFSRGDFFLVTHDDDIMEPTMLDRQLACFKANPRLLACSTNVSLIDEHGTVVQDGLYAMTSDRIFAKGEYLSTYLEEKLWLPASTYMIRRRVIYGAKKPMALMKAKYPANNDILGMVQLNMMAPIALLAQPLMRYRQHSSQECKNMDQSAPLLNTFNELVRQEKNQRVYRPFKASIHAHRARYQAQHLLLRHSKNRQYPTLLRELAHLKELWVQAVPQSQRLQDASFPLEILLHLLQLDSSLSREQIQTLAPSSLQDGPIKGYRHWLQAVSAGSSLFGAFPGFRRVAVLGSLLAAYLIALDAQKHGVEVLCCLDSSPVRQGKEIFGIPIVTHAELRRVEPSLDAVILSNEIGNADGMKRILGVHLASKHLPILSWKEMAEASNACMRESVLA